MFCEKCGHELKDNDLFCEKCGCSVVHDNSTMKVKNKKSKKKKFIIAAILAFCIITMIAGAIKGFEPEYDPDWQAENTETVATTEATATAETTESKTEEATESEVIKVGTVEQLYESDEYDNKTIEITGFVAVEDASDGTLKMFGAYSDAIALLAGSAGYEIPESERLTVTGVVQKDQYGAVVIVVESIEPYIE